METVIKENGKIKFYNEDRGFGFIRTSNFKDLFFHIKGVDKSTKATDLIEGSLVEFTTFESHKGSAAKDVVVIGAERKTQIAIDMIAEMNETNSMVSNGSIPAMERTAEILRETAIKIKEAVDKKYRPFEPADKLVDEAKEISDVVAEKRLENAQRSTQRIIKMLGEISYAGNLVTLRARRDILNKLNSRVRKVWGTASTEIVDVARDMEKAMHKIYVKALESWAEENPMPSTIKDLTARAEFIAAYQTRINNDLARLKYGGDSGISIYITEDLRKETYDLKLSKEKDIFIRSKKRLFDIIDKYNQNTPYPTLEKALKKMRRVGEAIKKLGQYPLDNEYNEQLRTRLANIDRIIDIKKDGLSKRWAEKFDAHLRSLDLSTSRSVVEAWPIAERLYKALETIGYVSTYYPDDMHKSFVEIYNDIKDKESSVADVVKREDAIQAGEFVVAADGTKIANHEIQTNTKDTLARAITYVNVGGPDNYFRCHGCREFYTEEELHEKAAFYCEYETGFIAYSKGTQHTCKSCQEKIEETVNVLVGMGLPKDSAEIAVRKGMYYATKNEALKDFGQLLKLAEVKAQAAMVKKALRNDELNSAHETAVNKAVKGWIKKDQSRLDKMNDEELMEEMKSKFGITRQWDWHGRAAHWRRPAGFGDDPTAEKTEFVNATVVITFNKL